MLIDKEKLVISKIMRIETFTLEILFLMYNLYNIPKNKITNRN